MVASGATRPVRAPASMAMLQSVMRPSMPSPRTASPANSRAKPVPPAMPMSPMMRRIRSLAPVPRGRAPSTWMRKLRARFCTRVWVARTCSTSLVPMPKAMAPKAPWVLVWLSPHTTVLPGRVNPCSGPMMWTMPWRGSRRGM